MKKKTQRTQLACTRNICRYLCCSATRKKKKKQKQKKNCERHTPSPRLITTNHTLNAQLITKRWFICNKNVIHKRKAAAAKQSPSTEKRFSFRRTKARKYFLSFRSVCALLSSDHFILWIFKNFNKQPKCILFLLSLRNVLSFYRVFFVRLHFHLLHD